MTKKLEKMFENHLDKLEQMLYFYVEQKF